MATLKTKTIEPSTGANVNLGNAGTAILVNSDSIQANVYKDSGGNTIFQSDGAGTLSNVNSGLSGAGPKLILSQTATTGTANISFTANIDSTYDVYMFQLQACIPVGSNALQFQVDTGTNTNYNITNTSVRNSFFHASAFTNDNKVRVITIESNLSRIPPWPGRIRPKSFTPKFLLMPEA